MWANRKRIRKHERIFARGLARNLQTATRPGFSGANVSRANLLRARDPQVHPPAAGDRCVDSSLSTQSSSRQVSPQLIKQKNPWLVNGVYLTRNGYAGPQYMPIVRALVSCHLLGSHPLTRKTDALYSVSAQRATATRRPRLEIKLATGAQLSEAGSYTSAVLRRPLVYPPSAYPPKT